MTSADPLRAAVSAGVLSSEEAHQALLGSIVQVARAIFGAKASSIMLWDEASDELVFEAVAGEGADTLVQTRFPASQGIAGWVLAAGQPLVIDDVAADPRFARSVAERTGYVPKGLMAVPLVTDERTLGVLQVLDRPERTRFSLQEMELLGLFGEQAAIALEVVGHARRAHAVLTERPSELGVMSGLAGALEGLEGARREAAVRLLAALEELLRG